MLHTNQPEKGKENQAKRWGGNSKKKEKHIKIQGGDALCQTLFYTC